MIKKTLINLLIYVGCFLLFYILKRGEVGNSYFLSHVALYMGSWGFAALLTRKFKQRELREFLPNLYPVIISFFLMLGIFAGVSMFFHVYDFSHHIIMNSLLSAIVIEVGYTLYTNGFQLRISKKRKLIISYKTMIIDFVILVWVMAFTLLYKMDASFYLNEKAGLFLGSALISWGIAGIFSHQFPPYTVRKGFWKYSWGYLKAYTVFMALITFTMLILRLPIQENFHLFGGGVLYTVWSFIVVVFSYVDQRQRKTDEVNVSLLRSNTLIDYEDSIFEVAPQAKYGLSVDDVVDDHLKEKLFNVYMKRTNGIYNFLNTNLELSSFDLKKSVILRSPDIFNVEVLQKNFLHAFINLHQINDFRRVNAFFIEVNKRLVDGGIFVGKLEPNKFRQKRFLKNFPFYLGHLFYFIDFIWRRVFPKLPLLKKIYFELTAGKNRAISMAEGLGRLYYCGFEIVATTEIEEYVYFIAKKTKEPLKDTNPSYGPLFKMRRIGKDGKEIFVYKLRTMHPFSEYLQKYMFERNRLKEGGKIKDDFRITIWGRIFRKLWIDELPMLINWIKGDLKMVGIRPLSQHFMSLYSEELKAKRIKTKPGLVPPFYADMPKTLEEIMQSELNYLAAYEQHPILTDVKYFFKVFYNIIIKKARSG